MTLPSAADLQAERQRMARLLRQMQAKLDAAEQRGRAPIAVVGLGCRLPGGADDAQSLWQLLESGTDAVTEVPPERWDIEAWYDPDPDAAGKMNTRCGGFLRGIDRFDAGFFGLSAREAISMDPQQRLVLEVAWRALEDAGIAPRSLAGTRAGVFLGLSTSDYARIGDGLGGAGALDTYSGTGGANSMAAGRLSYTLGLNGPSIVVDTACSSSLVAVHLAMQSLRQGECDIALAGGVNLVLLPEGTVALSRLHMMAPDGRCKAFAAGADGFVRGEGCGMVVLKRLDAAHAAGDRVLAVLRGSAVNQDGRSAGLTAPSGTAQQAVIREALANAGVAPGEVAYVEAHGTGTALGDPIELHALCEVLGAGREGALRVGSIKSNLGHLEAAAGIAGLLKAIESVRRGRIAPSLHCRTLNPHVDARGVDLRVPGAAEDWPAGLPRVAGISSFGFSGTNAHVVVQAAEPAPAAEAPAAPRPVEVLPLSARTPQALAQLLEAVRAPGVLQPYADACYTAGARRDAFPHRIAIVAADAGQAHDQLARAQPRHAAAAPRIAFVYTGQGAQVAGMGRELYAQEPVFRAAIDRCAEAVAGLLPTPLQALMFEGAGDLTRTAFAQPALLAFEVALTELLAHWGVRPEAVMGHSLGEFSAAVAAGAVDAADAMRLVVERGRLMQAQPAGSGMAAVLASPDEVRPWLADQPEVVIAAENGPRALTLAGPQAPLQRVCARLADAGLVSRPLAVSHAFHSPWMDPVLQPLEDAAARIAWQPPRIHLVSNVTGAPLAALDAAYWRRHTRAPVAFMRGLLALRALGCDTIVEIGPQPALLSAGRATLPDVPWIAAARHGHAAATQEALAALFTAGAQIDWAAVHAGRGRRPVPLPGHPFERRAYWRGQPPGQGLAEAAAARAPQRVTLARWPHPALDYLREHAVDGRAIVPAALLLQLASDCLRAQRGPGLLAEVRLHSALVPQDGCELALGLQGDAVRLESRAQPQAAWQLHLAARWVAQDAAPALPALGELPRPVEPAALYRWMAEGGIVLGPSFRRLRAAQAGDACARAELTADADAGLHPTLVDAALQAVALLTLGTGDGRMRVPVAIAQAWIAPQALAPAHEVRAWWHGGADGEAEAALLDAEGATLAHVRGIRFAALPDAPDWRGWLLARDWVAMPRPLPLDALAEQAMAPARGHPLLLEDSAAHRAAAEVGLAMDAAALAFAQRALAEVPPAAVASRHARLHALLRRRTAGAAAAAEDPAGTLAALAVRHPAHAAEVALLVRCGQALPAVLRGQQDPLALLFSGEGVGQVYRDAPVSALLNDCVAEAVLQALPAHGPVRILEAGAGTGGTTAQVLARLPADRLAEYAFTDVSPVLLAQAGQRFAQQPALHTRSLDFDSDVTAQGWQPGRYDIVIAANAVHAARDLAHALGQLRRLLAPGGTLVLLEGAGEQGWIDLVFGLTEGWWRFTDSARRPDYPLPDRAGWRDCLQAAGLACALGPVLAAPLHRQLVVLGRAQPPAGRWVVQADGDLGQALATQLQAVRIAPAQALPDGALAGVVFALPPDAIPPVDNATLLAQQQAWFAAVREGALACAARGLPLAIATTGAFDAAPWQATLWGLARAITAELPELRTRWIDLAPGLGTAAAAAMLAEELRGGDGEDQVLLGASGPVDEAGGPSGRGGLVHGRPGRQVARLRPLDATPDAALRFEVRPDAAYLVTGGYGGLGLATAQWLAGQGARHLVLLGRSAPAAAARQAIATLRAQGLQVHEVLGDVAEPSVLRDALAAAGRPVAAAFHAAGTLADATLAALDWPRMQQVLAPKLLGAWWLDRLLPADAALVLYSSAVTLIGSAGQANHVAANAFLDALAQARRAAGRPALSIAWGAWEGIGSATSEALAAQLQQAGLGTIPPAGGLRALGACLDRMASGQAAACIGVLPVQPHAFLRALPSPLPPVLRDWVPLLQAQAPTPVPAAAVAAPRASAAPDGLLDLVLAQAAEVLAADGPQALDPRRSLFESGLDSLMALELRRRLQERLGRPLPSTLLFDHSSPEALARHLGGAAADAAVPQANAARDEPIAIVGIGCRFPGGAADPEQFWQQLLAGQDAIGPWPAERDWTANPFPGQSRAGGFLGGVDRFDAGFFHIAPREAQSMDPQQRLLLETAWHALQHAGIAPASLAGSATGVFVGACNYDYAQVAYADGRIDAWSGTGGAPSVIAGRIAYTLGLEGPALVVDTACSSSLVTVHLACRSLRDGECRTALAGGVNLILAPASTTALGALQMLSPDGACKAFDADANGFVRGEGCALVVLKRLSDARADGDPILAVIRGSAINQDGRSSSLTAPSARAQEAVIRAALAQAGVPPDEVGYVEAHGTGTQLGDPIEISALRAVFAAGRAPDRPLAVGAVKSNLGHLEAAAGIAGLVKAVLAVRHGRLPPNLHLRARNPHIDAGALPLLLPTEVRDWPLAGARIAGVSSFGFSGTNAHVVLAEAPADHQPRQAPLALQAFQRERHWVQPAAAQRVDTAPLLGERRRQPGAAQHWTRTWRTDDPPWLADHRVGGVPTIPAAALLEVLAQAAGDAAALADIAFASLAQVDAPLAVHALRDGALLQLHAAAEGSDDWRLLASARLADAPVADPAPWADARARCTQVLPVDAFHARMEASGQLAYGPAFRVVAGAAHAPAPVEGEGWAWLTLQLPEGCAAPAERLHPALLDGVFQSVAAAGMALAAGDGAGGYLPAGLEQMHWLRPGGPSLAVWARLRLHGDSLRADFDVYTGTGSDLLPAALVRGLRLVPVRQAAPAAAFGYRPAWQAAEAAPAPDLSAWALDADTAQTATGRALLAALAETGRAPVPLAQAQHALVVAHGHAAAADASLHLLEQVRALLAQARPPRLCLVVEQTGDLPPTAAGALVGLVLAARAEHPELDARCITLPAGAGAQAVLRALAVDAACVEWRDGQALARSWEPLAPPLPGPSFALRRPPAGRLDDLQWVPRLAPATPLAGEVMIEVLAAGLNFRDVMNALGLYPGDAGALGGECAGIVRAVGPGVTTPAVGDRVLALTGGCHGSHVLAPAALAWPVPEGWTLAEAAAQPTVFLTAAWALRGPGAIAAGQRVLVHAGTGGLGMAAIQIARRAGATVYATAGTPAKRDLLRQLGVAGVADSRSPGFADDLLAQTGGAGVDIVLNSLSGALIEAGLRVLAPGGRFLEAGKAGIWTPEQVRAQRPDVGYHRIALDADIQARPAEVAALWHTLAGAFARGELTPLPVQAFPFAQAPSAYRHMQRALHTGRIALARRTFRADRAYVVTGGTGAVGGQIARWLAERGAGEVLVAGRHVPDAALQARMRQWAAGGAEVRFVAADVADAQQVAALLRAARRPLAGIFHAAGVLDDATLLTATPAQWARVFAPKLQAAMHLDAQTRALPLDHFVLVASAAGALGSAGQAAYAAANAALDALAQGRQAQGLPALAIDWGAWAGDGLAAGRAGPALAPEAALAALDDLLDRGLAQVLVLPQALPSARGPAPTAAAAAADWQSELDAVTDSERPALARALVRRQAAAILSLDEARIAADQPLRDAGLDSLMAVELRNALAAAVGRPLPAGLLFDCPTVDALAAHLLALGARPAAVAAPAAPTPPAAPIAADPVSDLTQALEDELRRAGY